MPLYEFSCNKCTAEFDALASYDDTGLYVSVICPKCGSHEKTKIMSMFAFNFTNPVGTDRWNSDSQGHGYRYKTKAPQVAAERALAEATSHMGSTPYSNINDMNTYDTGVHDVK
jgi:putative FmdB family regulatory protein